MKEAEEQHQRSKRKRLKEEALLASSIAARELRAVVTLASRRGLNAEEIFGHFIVEDAADANARGGVKEETDRRSAGKKEVVKGMAGLGISLSEDAAALVIEHIVRSIAERSPQRRKNLAAADDAAGQQNGSLGHSRRKSKEPADAATAGAAERVAKRGRRAQLKRSAPGPKLLSPLPRQHITAEDLWNFAHQNNVQDTRSQTGSEETKSPIARRDEGSGGGQGEYLHDLTPEKEERAPNTPSIYAGTGPSSKRRRTQDGNSSRRGGSATGMVGEGAPSQDVTHGMGGAHRLKPLPASAPLGGGRGNRGQSNADLQSWGNKHHPSRSTTPPSSAAGGVAAAATTATAASTNKRDGLEATAEKGKPRPRSMPTRVGSINPRGREDLKEGSGSCLGPRTKRAFPAGGGLGSATATSDHGAVPASAPREPYQQVEVASFPCTSPAEETTDGKDRVFYVKR